MADIYTDAEFIRWRDSARLYRAELLAISRKLSNKVRFSAGQSGCPACQKMHGKLYEFEDAVVYDVLPYLGCERWKRGLYCCASWTIHLPTVDGK